MRAFDQLRKEWIMPEQSLRERLHATHAPAESGKTRGILTIGAAIGLIAAVAGLFAFFLQPGLAT
jgi:hypothetical protein